MRILDDCLSDQRQNNKRYPLLKQFLDHFYFAICSYFFKFHSLLIDCRVFVGLLKEKSRSLCYKYKTTTQNV